jgi:general secretion pathway protein G
MRRNTGFTLVEILIVVIILGILAAIVIPQFTEASTDAREAALRSDLQTVRAQIELYRVQHGNYPGYTNTAGTLSAFSAALFVSQLEGQTDLDGNAGTDYGPYLQSFPANGFVSDTTAAKQVQAGDPTGTGKGWAFNTTTGKFRANDASAADQAL